MKPVLDGTVALVTGASSGIGAATAALFVLSTGNGVAGIGALAGLREYAKYQAHSVGPGRLLLAVCFTVSFTWFGLSSFWRVKKRAKRENFQ